jgi:uncharacterized protein
MDGHQLIDAVAVEVKTRMEVEGPSHDWWHIYRVWNNAKLIGKGEGADMTVVEISALLHDIADWKYNDADDAIGPRIAGEVLEKLGASSELIEHVKKNIYQGSFKGAGVKTEPETLEGKIMQDADRLDAIGAIGIARTFAYGGEKHRLMYDPSILPATYATKEEYAKNTSPTINHFYEKLLLLKDLMNTSTAKKLAQARHKYMVEYLDQFKAEWEGRA